jgi:ribosomal protein S18 acetylase RimI-like enzyme
MTEQFKYVRLDRKDITEEQFKQIMEVENSTGNGYSEDVMRSIWLEDEKDSNFVCFDGDKIVGHISFNPLSKRRNGSIYMVNLTVLPSYRRKGIALNLIYTACKYYENKGLREIMSLQVDLDNDPAIKLYKKAGFEIREPICEADEDDEQYIMDSTISNLIKTLEDKLNNKISK